MFRVVLALFLSLNFTLALESCDSCHSIEKFEPINHDFSCVECHILPKDRENLSHDDIITHPASSKYVDKFCGECHSDEIAKFRASTHYTHANEINTIFKTFGFDTNYTLQNLPKPKEIIDEPKELITDLLRRKCLSCHTENQSGFEVGTFRGKGCMACHAEYRSDGKYRGSDKTMRNKSPYSRHHAMGKPKMSACLSCHNKEFVGTDYLGLFPKDYHDAYRAPILENGKFPSRIYGGDYHRLNSDVHLEAGLDCTDCHKKDHTLGTKKVSCKSCHEPKPSYEHAIYHENLSCTSCHATWQMSNYELSLLRDDTPNYKQWANLTYQEDGYLERFLNLALSDDTTKPVMPDYLTGNLKDGVWYSGWRFRRWEHLLLGNDENGVVQILRPFFQYRLSYKDKNGTTIFDNYGKDEKFDAFMPFTPHTIGKTAKPCEKCHENLLQTRDFSGEFSKELFKGKVLKGSPLSNEQLNKLNSDRYKKIRAKMLFEDSRALSP